MLAITLVATANAPETWPQIAKVTADLISALPDGCVTSVHWLGTAMKCNVESWRANMPLPLTIKNSISLLGPVMRALHTERTFPDVIVLIGLQRVFDLNDWLGSGPTWAALRIGDNSLQTSSNGLLEVTPENIDELLSLIHAAPAASKARTWSHLGAVSLHWDLDRTGFPTVKVPALNAFVQLFPLTKHQFEHYLCAARPAEQNDATYEAQLQITPRLSACASSYDSYEQIFITGMVPQDAEALIAWHGRGISVLSSEQWRVAYQWLTQQRISVPPFEVQERMAPEACHLWDGLMHYLNPQTMLDLALMRGGVIEWVKHGAAGWVGMGKPRPRFFSTAHDPLSPTPLQAFTPYRRDRVWGLRFMMRG